MYTFFKCKTNRCVFFYLLQSERSRICNLRPRCGGERSQLYGQAAGGQDLCCLESGCRHGNHNGAMRMTGSPRAVNNRYALILWGERQGAAQSLL